LNEVETGTVFKKKKKKFGGFAESADMCILIKNHRRNAHHAITQKAFTN